VTRSRLTRITVTGGTAAMCLALAAPAMACMPGPGGQPGNAVTTAATATQDLAQKKAMIEQFIANRVQQVQHAAAQAAADPQLSAAQKSAFATQAGDVVAALSSLSDEVSAAATPAELQADLANAAALFPHLAPMPGRQHPMTTKKTHKPATKPAPTSTVKATKSTGTNRSASSGSLSHAKVTLTASRATTRPTDTTPPQHTVRVSHSGDNGHSAQHRGPGVGHGGSGRHHRH
jgi:hypothetical protein